MKKDEAVFTDSTVFRWPV